MEPTLEDLARERRERTAWFSWKSFGMILLCLMVGAVSGEITRAEIADWYAALKKPAFTPPDRLFAPVWSALYLLMGVAAGRLWQAARTKPTAVTALRTFFVLLAANALWSLLFFGLHRPGLALLDILAYLTLLVIWIRQLRRLDVIDAGLQLPHLLWVSYATALNATIWWLNK